MEDKKEERLKGKKKEDLSKVDRKILKLVLQELGEDPYHQLNITFALTTIIPFLVFLYLLVVKFFTFDIFAGNTGIVVLFALLVAMSGYLVGYHSIKAIFNKIIFYSVKVKHDDQVKSTLIASVSHEFRTPLSVMRLGIANLLDGLLGKLSEGQKELLEGCQEIIDRLTTMIKELLDTHSVEAGMLGMKRKLCDIIGIVDNQLREIDIIFKDKNINLMREVRDADLTAWGDEKQITQVVSNLLGNAAKFTPEGGSIIVRVFPIDKFIRFEVADNGPGIPGDKLDKIFNKFERLGSKKEGSGLGLALAKDIVENHKGKIWVESKLGKGSKFVVVLPRDLREW